MASSIGNSAAIPGRRPRSSRPSIPAAGVYPPTGPIANRPQIANRPHSPLSGLDDRAALQRALGHIEVEKTDMIECPEVGNRYSRSPNQRQLAFPGSGKAEDRDEIAESAEGPAEGGE